MKVIKRFHSLFYINVCNFKHLNEFKDVQQWNFMFFCYQFEQAADSELSWLTDAEGKLLSMGEIRLEQDQTTAQLQAQKVSLPYHACV